MASNDTTALKVSPREAGHSRATRRLRRTGAVPGVVYGGGEDPVAFQVGERTLRHALQGSGAVMQLEVEGGSSGPVVVKELVRHPVTGLTMHLDLLRVRMDVAIQSTTILELTGSEDAPGVREGGVLEQVTRELAIEALPADIPESVAHDVSEMQIGDTITIEQVKAPSGVTLLDDAETVVATLTPPRLQAEVEEEIEAETEVVGEGEAPAEAEGDESGDAGSSDDGDSE
ncbi:MAG TPA: 50S ribosomal protein L25 [Solirubrobacteraceae bacterium]|nr:50S ribosomal protein L25 [Solirubrobacteraceae bacterium]